MFNQILDSIQSNPKLKKYLTWLGVFLAILILAFVLWPRKNYQQYEMSSTGLKNSVNFTKLAEDNKLYYYNGASFVSKEVDSGNETSLSSGLRLPTPDKLFWANSKGALMTFKSSYYYTAVQDELNSMGKKIDSSTKNYTWYLDFASGKIHFAYALPLESTTVSYSTADSSFYFMDSSPALEEGPNLLAFNTVNFATSIVSSSLNLTGVKSLETCPKDDGNTLVCIIALDRSTPKNEILYKVSKDGSLGSIFESSGILLPTNRAERYLSIGNEDTKTKEGSPLDGNEGGGLSGPAELINVVDKSIQKLGFDISGAGSAVGINADNKFYTLDNSFSGRTVKKKTPYYYRSGQLSGDSAKSRQYEAKINGEVFESLFINSSGYGPDGSVLMNDYDGNQIIVTPKGSIVNLKMADSSSVEDGLKACSRGLGSTPLQYFAESKTYRLYFDDTSDLSSKIEKFTTCLDDKKQSLFGYNINYFITDPASGKIVND